MLPIQKTPELRESEITLISEGTTFEGTLALASVARVHGTIKGKLVGLPGSLIVLGTQSMVEGTLEADTLWVEGFVRGEIAAKTKVILRPSARVVADIEAPSIEIEPGAHFEGMLRMEHLSKASPAKASPASDTTPPSA